MEILQITNLNLEEILKKIQQKRSGDQAVWNKVIPIIEQVKEFGDIALKELTKKFDKVDLDSFVVTKQEIIDARSKIPAELIKSLQIAKKNIETFHESLITNDSKIVETMPGVNIWRVFRPIEKVGLYIPGGTAAYPSTVLMLAVPAKVAGCREISICTPAGSDGLCNPAVLVAADLCEIEKIYKIGGAQAIAALAYGTKTVSKADKIFGPGNQFVATAKTYLQAFGKIAIDMPAGPSEVMVIAEDKADPKWIAADLLSQLEHGQDSQAILICFSKDFAEKVILTMENQMKTLPRLNIIQEAYKISFAVIVNNAQEAVNLANGYASEHLEIVVNEKTIEKQILNGIQNAGSIFLGKYSSEPLGDYATGSNHTLPTSGYARMYPPLSTESFGKYIQVQEVSAGGIKNLKEIVETIANAEGLKAHAQAISIRFE